MVATSELAPKVQANAQVRANWARFVMNKADGLHPDKRPAIEAAMPRELLEFVRKSVGISMIPFECHHRLAEAHLASLGYAGVVDLWTAAVVDACNSVVLFKGLLNTVRMLVGDHQQLVLKASAQAWKLVTHHCGEMRAHGTDGPWFGISWSDVPVAYLESMGLRAAWEGSIRGAFHALGDEVAMRSEVIVAKRQVVIWSKA